LFTLSSTTIPVHVSSLIQRVPLRAAQWRKCRRVSYLC
jgi:hypothetical protein